MQYDNEIRPKSVTLQRLDLFQIQSSQPFFQPSYFMKTLVTIFLFTLTQYVIGQSIHEDNLEEPLIIGYGVGLFELGPVLYDDDFSNLEKWVVQIQPKEGGKARVEINNGTLDCYVPGRGCTVWFHEKLNTRIAITYNVLCPTPEKPIKGLQPRDINNFWLASDPLDSKNGLFDATQYTGAFNTYHKMYGYYASTGGGGGAKSNITTRMRRYPRVVDSKPVDHLALNDKDGKPGYLITPDKWMKVQLVAFDDVIQYIVDGKLVYEVKNGDSIFIEQRDPQGSLKKVKDTYDLKRYPYYTEGFFGFRMVGTHHIYSDFKVHSLKPVK